MDLVLYDRPDCPFCWKLRLGLAELGLLFETVETRLGEKHADMLRLSPGGTVPVLVDRTAGLVIWESAVALDYVNEVADGGLFGRDAEARARIRLVETYSDRTVGSALRDIIFEKRARPEADWDHSRIRDGEVRWRGMLDRLEGWCGEACFGGDDFTAADCALMVRFGLAEAYDAPVTDQHPRLHAWYERHRQRPSFSATRPDWYPMHGVAA